VLPGFQSRGQPNEISLVDLYQRVCQEGKRKNTNDDSRAARDAGRRYQMGRRLEGPKDYGADHDIILFARQ